MRREHGLVFKHGRAVQRGSLHRQSQQVRRHEDSADTGDWRETSGSATSTDGDKPHDIRLAQ